MLALLRRQVGSLPRYRVDLYERYVSTLLENWVEMVCLAALNYGTQPWEDRSNATRVRSKAATILAKLEPLHYDHRAYEALVQVKNHDDESRVRDAAYVALGRLALAREHVSNQ